MQRYDRIVIGVGGAGSAAMYHLARRGVKTLGIEQFRIAHDRGSSHGETRIIRQAYFEHPAYVPLLRRAYELWHELEKVTGKSLLDPVGLVEIGPPDGIVISGVEKSAEAYGVEVERLHADDVLNRFPCLRVPPGTTAVFEPHAGYLRVEECVAAHAQLGLEHGADLVEGTTVREVSFEGGDAVVRTDDGLFVAQGIVITAGAWAPAFLPASVPLTILRKHMHWLQCDDPRMLASHGAPAFFYELPDAYFYGFPSLGDGTFKVAEHSGGESIADPNQRSMSPDLLDSERVRQFSLEVFRPEVHTTNRHQVCMYTMTPDEHFVVDQHLDRSQVVFAAGLSGHGFKFTPVIGEILADLSLQSSCDLPIDFLGLDRFGEASD